MMATQHWPGLTLMISQLVRFANGLALSRGVHKDEDKKRYRDYSAHAFTDEEIKKYDLENFKKELVTNDNED